MVSKDTITAMTVVGKNTLGVTEGNRKIVLVNLKRIPGCDIHVES